MPRHLYKPKSADYFGHCRRDVISMIPREVTRAKVLEIGCGRGHTLIAMKRMGIAEEAVGLELVALPDESCERSQIDRYMVADIETDVPDLLPKAYFDLIVCADVLEHLVDPWRALVKIRKWLRREGLLIASLPNVREVRTLFGLIVKGDFRYRDEGVLDRTHLRFFCKRNMLELLVSEDMVIDRVGTDLSFKANWRAELNRLTFGAFEDFLVTQYLIVARKIA